MTLRIVDRITAVLSLKGDLTVNCEDPLKEEVKEAERNSIENILLDFRTLDHIDDAGVSALIKLSLLTRRYRMQLYAYGLSVQYRRLLSFTGVADFIPEYENTIDTSLLSEVEKPGDGSTSGWLPFVERIKIEEKPNGALLKNMANRKMLGPLQGFGCLWQKTYTLPIRKNGITPTRVIEIIKRHFPEFQPSYNRFYPTSKGIIPGAPVFIDSKTPGGIVSTGVMVMYADETSFSFITPAGHPEAGWVSFRAEQKPDNVEMKIEGLASASDPLYELAFRVAGSKLQENIWKHVLGKLARFLEIDDTVIMRKILVDDTLHWHNAGNIRYNAQIRTLPYNIVYPFRKD